MKTKIIIKMDRDLSTVELDILCKELENGYTELLGNYGINTDYEILTHKGGANVSHKSFCHVKNFKGEAKQ